MKNLYTLILVVILAQCTRYTALADCTDGAPEAWLNIYWNNDPLNFGDKITYNAYVNNSQYKLAISDVGSWWGGRISSLDCMSNYPADWWAYDHLECNGSQAGWIESGSGDKNLMNNDDLGSLRFQCKTDKQQTWLAFCEHINGGGKSQQIRLFKYGNAYGVVWQIRQLDGRWNDKISAVESGVNGIQPKNAYWYFYKEADFNPGDTPPLVIKNNQNFMYVGNNLNDKITSFRLVITNSATPPVIYSTPGDIDCDGTVNLLDLNFLAADWLLNYEPFPGETLVADNMDGPLDKWSIDPGTGEIVTTSNAYAGNGALQWTYSLPAAADPNNYTSIRFDFGEPQDLSVFDEVSLWLYRHTGNTPEDILYLKFMDADMQVKAESWIEGDGCVVDPNDQWSQWLIDPNSLLGPSGVGTADEGDLTAIRYIMIGTGSADRTDERTGTIDIDEFTFVQYPDCCAGRPLADLDTNNLVDIFDLAYISEKWLQSMPYTE